MKTNINYNCKLCDYNTDKKANFDRHIITVKHKNNLNIENRVTIYDCSLCGVSCNNIYQLNLHIDTINHKNKLIFNNSRNIIKTYSCRKCQKEYEKYNSYWRHEAKCNFDPIDESSELYSNTISKLLLENKELHNFIIEQTKERNEETKERNEESKEMIKMMVDQNNKLLELSKSNVNNNNSNNTINGNVNNTNKFNINLFLNEKCKDAMNLKDFIHNIQVTYEDIENNGELGFVAGMTKIFLDNLKQIDIFDRPIHCTDVKRETMYIKEEDKWEKEEDKKKLSRAITEISRKSLCKLIEMTDENPEEFKDMDSPFSVRSLSIQQNSIAGYNREVYADKIIKTIAKETMIEKHIF